MGYGTNFKVHCLSHGTSQTVVYEAGVRGVQAHPQKFWFVENAGKIPVNLGIFPENLGKILENPGKILEYLDKIDENPGENGVPTLFDFKKWRSAFAEKHHDPKTHR